ncbi:MAG: hypothetical protein OMM_08420 [Candidatus Magnetoglobus multicellularis str. Araruama]|uniref:Response regulatory domain-containing protein n=1 Tax=Candidatus Magnetoglobus multicellularis str. Araruama TaxID=890399 RepID=A0A1V1P833_9BACT|nr:MAG: hypothetical protein OMM_08420 [Candidatus Magnetoglobus multicellularis str. Araruama]
MEINIPSHPTILIVDDVPINLKVLRAHLEPAGYYVLEAGSGQEALVQAEKHPDLILLDIMMPGMDGIETCKNLKTIHQQQIFQLSFYPPSLTRKVEPGPWLSAEWILLSSHLMRKSWWLV